QACRVNNLVIPECQECRECPGLHREVAAVAVIVAAKTVARKTEPTMNQALNSELLLPDVGSHLSAASGRLAQCLRSVRAIPLLSTPADRSGAARPDDPEGADATRRVARIDL